MVTYPNEHDSGKYPKRPMYNTGKTRKNAAKKSISKRSGINPQVYLHDGRAKRAIREIWEAEQLKITARGFGLRYEDWDQKKITIGTDRDGNKTLYEFWDKKRTHLRTRVALDKDGKMHGLGLEWDEKGKLDQAINYDHGVLHGLVATFQSDASGNTMFKRLGFYDHDTQHGYRFAWHENKSLQEITPFKKGDVHGHYRVWNDDKSLRMDQMYSNYKKIDPLVMPSTSHLLGPVATFQSNHASLVQALSMQPKTQASDLRASSPLFAEVPDDIMDYVTWMGGRGYGVAMPSTHQMRPLALPSHMGIPKPLLP